MLSLEVNPGNCGWLLGPPSPFLERWNVLRTSLIGRQGGEERKIESAQRKKSEKPIIWVLGESGHHWVRGTRPHHPGPSVTPLAALSLPSASRLSLGRTGQGTGHPVPVVSSLKQAHFKPLWPGLGQSLFAWDMTAESPAQAGLPASGRLHG